MSITQQQAVEALRYAVATATGLPVILARADAVRPASAYVTIDVLWDGTVGYPFIDGDTVAALRQLRAQVSGFGAAAYELLLTAAARIQLPNDVVGRDLKAAGVYLQTVTDVMNMSAGYRTGHEPRSLFTLDAQYEWTATGSNGVDAAASIVVDIHARGAVNEDLVPAIVVPEAPP